MCFPFFLKNNNLSRPRSYFFLVKSSYTVRVYGFQIIWSELIP